MARTKVNVFEAMRARCKISASCASSDGADFIDSHISSTKILVHRTDEILSSVLVFTDSLGPDEAYLFVYKDADLTSVDYFTWNNEHRFFCYEEMHIVADLGYRKLKTMECNVSVNDEVWAHFKGPLKSVKDTSLLSSGHEQTNINPYIVCPINEKFTINSRVVIKDQSWLITDADIYTIDGIGFYYLERVINASATLVDKEAVEDVSDGDLISIAYIGQTLTMSTENGFVETNLEIEITERKSDKVSFKLKEAGDLIVSVKQNGLNSDIQYLVKESV